MLSKEFKLTAILLLIFGIGFYQPVYSKSHHKVYEMESVYFRVTIDTTGAIYSFYKNLASQIYPVKPCVAGATKLLFHRVNLKRELRTELCKLIEKQ